MSSKAKWSVNPYPNVAATHHRRSDCRFRLTSHPGPRRLKVRHNAQDIRRMGVEPLLRAGHELEENLAKPLKNHVTTDSHEMHADSPHRPNDLRMTGLSMEMH
jgi:hypothetical protein